MASDDKHRKPHKDDVERHLGLYIAHHRLSLTKGQREVFVSQRLALKVSYYENERYDKEKESHFPPIPFETAYFFFEQVLSENPERLSEDNLRRLREFAEMADEDLEGYTKAPQRPSRPRPKPAARKPSARKKGKAPAPQSESEESEEEDDDAMDVDPAEDDDPMDVDLAEDSAGDDKQTEHQPMTLHEMKEECDKLRKKFKNLHEGFLKSDGGDVARQPFAAFNTEAISLFERVRANHNGAIVASNNPYRIAFQEMLVACINDSDNPVSIDCVNPRCNDGMFFSGKFKPQPQGGRKGYGTLRKNVILCSSFNCMRCRKTYHPELGRVLKIMRHTVRGDGAEHMEADDPEDDSAAEHMEADDPEDDSAAEHMEADGSEDAAAAVQTAPQPMTLEGIQAQCDTLREAFMRYIQEGDGITQFRQFVEGIFTLLNQDITKDPHGLPKKALTMLIKACLNNPMVPVLIDCEFCKAGRAAYFNGKGLHLHKTYVTCRMYVCVRCEKEKSYNLHAVFQQFFATMNEKSNTADDNSHAIYSAEEMQPIYKGLRQSFSNSIRPENDVDEQGLQKFADDFTSILGGSFGNNPSDAESARQECGALLRDCLNNVARPVIALCSGRCIGKIGFTGNFFYSRAIQNWPAQTMCWFECNTCNIIHLWPLTQILDNFCASQEQLSERSTFDARIAEIKERANAINAQIESTVKDDSGAWRETAKSTLNEMSSLCKELNSFNMYGIVRECFCKPVESWLRKYTGFPLKCNICKEPMKIGLTFDKKEGVIQIKPICASRHKQISRAVTGRLISCPNS